MRVLVTGGNGFVGEFLAKYLDSLGHEVSLTIRDGIDKGVSFHCFSIGDIDGGTDWSRAVSNQDAVIHLANIAHVPLENKRDSIALLHRVNVEGSLALAEAAIRQNVKRFVFLSSIKVNGESTSKEPFQFSDVPSPEDLYAESKLEAEQRLEALCTDAGMELVIIRPPLIYGPGVKGNLATLKRMVKKPLPLPLLSIKNSRDLISLKNLSDLIGVCMEHPNAENKVFLCSDGDSISTPKLINYIAKAQNRRVFLLPFPVKVLVMIARVTGKTKLFQRLAGDLRIDISYTEEMLGWSPPFSVADSMLWAFSDERGSR